MGLDSGRSSGNGVEKSLEPIRALKHKVIAPWLTIFHPVEKSLEPIRALKPIGEGMEFGNGGVQ